MLVVCVALLFTAAWAIYQRQGRRLGPAPAFCPVVGDEAVTQVLKPIRQKFNVPAMAAAVVTSDGIKFVGAVGVRKRGTEIPVTPRRPLASRLGRESHDQHSDCATGGTRTIAMGFDAGRDVSRPRTADESRVSEGHFAPVAFPSRRSAGKS